MGQMSPVALWQCRALPKRGNYFCVLVRVMRALMRFEPTTPLFGLGDWFIQSRRKRESFDSQRLASAKSYRRNGTMRRKLRDFPAYDQYTATPLEELLDRVQRTTIAYFWEGAHPVSALAYDRRLTWGDARNDLVSISGSGFSFLAIIVAVSRGWIDRRQAMERMLLMVAFLKKVPRFHGAFPHFINGATGEVVPFSRHDDGGDLVETALLLQGMICASQYFDGEAPGERLLRILIQELVDEVEWVLVRA